MKFAENFGLRYDRILHLRFSTEEYETNRYNDGINVALSYGIKNAFVGATVQAFSTYINLGTSILVLWYGGETIFDTSGTKLSIGNLITFQLYWNMMNTAFISLGNVCPSQLGGQ